MSRGKGGLYQRKDKNGKLKSQFYWCSYYRHGKQIRQPTGETDQRKAQKFLDRKIREVANEVEGLKAFITPRQEKVTVNEILDDLVENYKRGGKRGIHREVPPQMISRLKQLREFFGTWRAIQVGSRDIEEFKSKLKTERKANSTVNRSLQLLGQAYNYAITSDPPKLSRAPRIERYSEQGNARKGKFTPAEAEAIFNSLPPYMADVARFAYETGHRSSEIRKLWWSHVETDAIRVPGRIAKSARNARLH